MGKRKYQEQLKKDFGQPRSAEQISRMKERLEEIRLYEKEVGYEDMSNVIDPVTWNDLEMNELFYRMNHTKSYLGEQVLYYDLHVLRTKEELEKKEERIRFFQKEEKKRWWISGELFKIGKIQEAYYLPLFLKNMEAWPIIKPYLYWFLQLVLVCSLVGSIFFKHSYCKALLLAVVMVNVVIYLRSQQKFDGVYHSIQNLKQVLVIGTYLNTFQEQDGFTYKEEQRKAVAQIQPLLKKMRGWQGGRRYSSFGDPGGILWDYLRGISLLEITSYCRIMRLIQGKNQAILQVIHMVGQADEEIGLLSYRQSIPKYCTPLLKEGEEIRMTELIHPMIENPIPNDFALKRRALITGNNASGKSTLMKALAINCILAQTVYFCTAKEVVLPSIYVMTSMALRDNVLAKESYYFREAKRIQQMLSYDGTKPVLIVIDEILKGTNTLERLGASYGILEYLTKTPNFVVVATHDMELVKMMEQKYSCYYFESNVTKDDLCFSYTIHPGLKEESNAIAILSYLSYPEEIVSMAKKITKRLEH